MTINDYLDMEALDNILEQWAAATHMIAVVLDDEVYTWHLYRSRSCLVACKFRYFSLKRHHDPHVVFRLICYAPTYFLIVIRLSVFRLQQSPIAPMR